MSDLIGRFSLTSMEDIVNISAPLLDEGKKIRFSVVGNSMFPLLCSQRDKVTAEKALNVKRCDVILYRRNDGSFVLHRVIGKGKLGYKLCGDNQLAVEYPVKPEDVVAKVTSFERKGKEYSVKVILYRLYSFLWCCLIWLTQFGLKIIHNIHKLRKRGADDFEK